MAEQVERRDPLRDARRMVRRKLDHAVAEADALGSLARRPEEHLRRGRVRVLLEEVVLDLPRVLVAQRVGKRDLLDRLVQQPVFAVLVPRAGELMLVEDAEAHSRKPAGERPRSATAGSAGDGASTPRSVR